MALEGCVFCRIIAGEVEAFRVYEDEHTVVFLDSGPLFPGHCLVCPKKHYETLADIPPDLMAPLFANTQLIAKAVEHGLKAAGSLIAVNNKVSQSVPHLHVHVIPRNRGDGLKGFFWPRRPYKNAEEARETQRVLESAVTYLRSHV